MTMQAGKKLDEAVAALVMGFTVEHGTTHVDGRELPWTVFRNGSTTHNPIPYSTDLLAAMEVEARLWGFGWAARFIRLADGRWWAEFAKRGSFWTEYAIADTLPLAICRAALAAVSPTDKQE